MEKIGFADSDLGLSYSNTVQAPFLYKFTWKPQPRYTWKTSPLGLHDVDKSWGQGQITAFGLGVIVIA